MPHCNRVRPDGLIFATSARGMLMGNRGGPLHDGEKRIVRPYKSRRWISCVLQYKGLRREVMAPERYTELFFLDEAVALAAGHRPCGKCRQGAFRAFLEAWRRGPAAARHESADIQAIDRALHLARFNRDKEKVTYIAPLESLPDGSFIRYDDSFFLVFSGNLLLWSPEGYSEPANHIAQGAVTVLTPEPFVRCLKNGYRPIIHESARLR